MISSPILLPSSSWAFRQQEHAELQWPRLCIPSVLSPSTVRGFCNIRTFSHSSLLPSRNLRVAPKRDASQSSLFGMLLLVLPIFRIHCLLRSIASYGLPSTFISEFWAIAPGWKMSVHGPKSFVGQSSVFQCQPQSVICTKFCLVRLIWCENDSTPLGKAHTSPKAEVHHQPVQSLDFRKELESGLFYNFAFTDEV